jgi:DNA-binding NarL/FixJ family response regulator
MDKTWVLLADVKRMRSHYPSLKILVVSAYDDDAYVVGLLDAGCRCHMS